MRVSTRQLFNRLLLDVELLSIRLVYITIKMSFARSPLWNAFIASTIAAPILKATRLVHKRYPPSIASGFTAQQTTQITDAFRDALELASYALTAPSGTVDLIYTKYFNTGDRDLVNSMTPKPRVPWYRR